MAAVVSFAEGLLNLGKELLGRHDADAAARIFRRLLAQPGVSPDLLAESARLLAQAKAQTTDYQQIRTAAKALLQQQPDSAQGHYLFGKAVAEDPEYDRPKLALKHLSLAANLAPSQPEIQADYGLQLIKTARRKQGLAVLEKTFHEFGDDPGIVEKYAIGLILADRPKEAEVVAISACDRHQRAKPFRQVAGRVRDRAIEAKLQHVTSGSTSARRNSNRETPRYSRSIVPLRNFERAGGDRPRSNKKPSEKPKQPAPRKTADSFADLGPVELSPNQKLSEILKKLGGIYTAGIYVGLGLLGKEKPAEQRQEIASAFAEPGFLDRQVQSLPADSRRLLRTILRTDGYVPASVLFQNTGPDAPPPDYVQPLLAIGVLYFGKEILPNSSRLVAVVPVDLHARLAKLLRVRSGK